MTFSNGLTYELIIPSVALYLEDLSPLAFCSCPFGSRVPRPRVDSRVTPEAQHMQLIILVIETLANKP